MSTRPPGGTPPRAQGTKAACPQPGGGLAGAWLLSSHLLGKEKDECLPHGHSARSEMLGGTCLSPPHPHVHPPVLSQRWWLHSLLSCQHPQPEPLLKPGKTPGGRGLGRCWASRGQLSCPPPRALQGLLLQGDHTGNYSSACGGKGTVAPTSGVSSPFLWQVHLIRSAPHPVPSPAQQGLPHAQPGSHLPGRHLKIGGSAQGPSCH